MSQTPGEPGFDQQPPWSGEQPPQPPPPGWGSPQTGWATQPGGYQQQAGYGQQPGHGQQPGWGPAGAIKPGIIPLRPLAVGEILDGAFTAMRRYPRATFGLSALVSILSALAQFVLMLSLRDVMVSTGLETFDGGDLAGLLGVSAVTFLITGLASLVLTGMLTIVISEAVLGRSIDLGNVWARVRPRILPLIGAAILVGIVTTLGFIALIIPGIYLAVALSFTTPALILEGATVTGAMGRSRELIKGDWWRVLGILILAAIIANIVGQVIQTPFALLGGGGGGFGGAFGGGFGSGADAFEVSTSSLVISSLGQMVAGTVTAPITAGVTALLYIDRRMRREGLDVSLARTATAAAAGTGR